MRKLFLFLFIFIAISNITLAQKTTVYIVRHAEKNLSDPNSKDPSLSGEGLQRAQDLLKYLDKEKIAAVYSTNYIRTISTGDPVAKKANQKVIIYDPGKVEDLVQQVNTNYKGKTVLVVGHSNTILQLVKAFGGNTNIAEIKDSEYSYLFKVSLDGNTTDTKELHYGNQ